MDAINASSILSKYTKYAVTPIAVINSRYVQVHRHSSFDGANLSEGHFILIPNIVYNKIK